MTTLARRSWRARWTKQTNHHEGHPMKLALALAAYIGSIVTANYLTTHYGLVSVGFGLLVTAGTFAAGFALLARDFVHRYGDVRWALGAITAGAVVSWFVTDPFIVVASTVAFVGAELVDLLVFIPLRRRAGFIGAAFVSNVVSAPVDTLLFLSIAGFPVTTETVGGQFIGKVVWATLIPLAAYFTAREVAARYTESAAA